MIDLSAVLLARIQFGFTVAFHIMFPALTIGLASYLAVLEGLWLWTAKERYLTVFKYWLRIFAVVFAMGVVSGVVMAFQLGTNWATFADKVGPVLGPLLTYEVLSAFFMEAGFLGVMLFGLNRVGKKLHFMATMMVAMGTLMSAFWILSANSWMHTPSGYAINDAGQFIPDDWTAVIFNPSFPYRIVHMVLAAYLTTALVVGGVGAWHLLRDRANEPARLMFSMAMWMVVIVTPFQLVAGDTQGLNTLEHQPAKIAAIEGHFAPERGAPLILFGLPDMEAHETKYKLEIPKLGSLILTHEWDGEVPGLNEWSPRDWPDAPVVFWSFRVMVGLGLLMLGLGAFGLYCRWRRRLYDSSWLHRAAVLMTPAGFLAVLSGWITTEVGRQPFTVYGLLRTQESASPINAPAVGTSLVAFIVAYFAIFGLGVYYALRLAMKTPSAGVPGPETEKPVRTPGKALAEEIGGPDGSAKMTGDAP